MAIARGNLSGIKQYADAIKSGKEQLDNAMNQVKVSIDSALQDISKEKTKADKVKETCAKGISKVSDKIAELKAKLSDLQSELASTPPEIEIHYTDDDGSTYTRKVPNPRYDALLSEIAQAQEELQKYEKLLSALNELSGKIDIQIDTLKQSQKRIDDLKEKLVGVKRNSYELLADALIKLKKIQDAISRYMSVKIEAPKLFGKFNHNGSFNEMNVKSKHLVPKEEYKEYKNIYKSLDKMDLPTSYKEKLCNRFSKMDEKVKKLYSLYAKDLRCLDTRTDGDCYFSEVEGGFKINAKDDEKNELGIGNTYFHESAHMIDSLIGKKLGSNNSISYNRFMPDAIYEDYDNSIRTIMYENHCNQSKAKEILNDELWNNPNALRIVSDVFGGVTYKEVEGRWGHELSYWQQPGSNLLLGNEAFAEITACIACNDNECLDFTNKYLKKTMKIYNEILEEVLDG